MAGLLETMGWAARLWSSQNVLILNAYLMQSVHLLTSCGRDVDESPSLSRITTTIIAPTPLVASNFIILGKLITKLGTQYSRLKPNWCTYSTYKIVLFTHLTV